MEKLQRINSVLFTIMASLVIVSLIFLAIEAAGEFLPRGSRHYDDTMISSERASELASQEKRAQIISFDQVALIDSTNGIYLMPVTQIKLSEIEAMRIQSQALHVRADFDDFPYYTGGSNLNNIVILDLKKNTAKTIFKQRSFIAEYRVSEIGGENVVFMLVCTRDSNGDCELSDKDLHVYRIAADSLEKISGSAEHMISFHMVDKTEEIFLTIGVDRNQDSRFDREEESVIIKRVNWETKKIEDLVDVKTFNELQAILDGKGDALAK